MFLLESFDFGQPINDPIVKEIISESKKILMDMDCITYPFEDVVFRTRPTTAHLGLCRFPESEFGETVIFLSSYELVDAENRKDQIMSIVLHELLHFVDFWNSVDMGTIFWSDSEGKWKVKGGRKVLGHKGNWKFMADIVSRETGLSIERTREASKAFDDAESQKRSRYIVKCNTCGYEYYFPTKSATVKIVYKEKEGRLTCKKCGGHSFHVIKNW